MRTVEDKLRVLRAWFVGCYCVEWIVGMVVSTQVIDRLRQSVYLGRALNASSPGLVLWSSLVFGAVLLALALLVFQGLLRLNPWARFLLLIAAWITAGGAVLSLLGTPFVGAIREHFTSLVPEAAWGGLAGINLFSNLLKLAICGYIITVLQVDHQVRSAFVPSEKRL